MKIIFAVYCFLLPGLALHAQDTLIHLNPNPDTLLYHSSPAAPLTEEVYHIKKGIDIPLSAAATAWTLFGFTKIYGREATPAAEIYALDVNDINSFDRPVTTNYSLKAKEISDLFFYGSMPLPLLLLLDKPIRKDGFKVGLLYLEAISVTGTLYTASAMLANRFRPYAYNSTLDIDTRRRGGAKNSFYAGHVALVGTTSFFMAKVLSDYHPHMRNKWILYSLAGAATATTAVLRVEAGQHFYTDVMLGAVMGTLSGILIPNFHKNNKNNRLSIAPMYNSNSRGIVTTYKLP